VGDVRVEVWFLKAQEVHEVSCADVYQLLMCFNCDKAVYFYEPGKSKNEPVANENTLRIPTLATVSPEPSRYHEFRKIANVVYMPVFKEIELRAIGKDMQTRPGFANSLTPLYTDESIRSRNN